MNTQILLEIVPRNIDQLKSELNMIKENYKQINGINIPDLLRFELRSWEAAKTAQMYFKKVIPHLRAIDFNLDERLAIIDYLQKNKINELLIIKGDPPQDMSKQVFPNTSIKLIKKIKTQMPNIKIYAAIDQYRVSIKDEFDYIEMKKDAGVEAFLTQPFFDMRLIDIYSEKLKDMEVYWGISPVTSLKSKNYWESRNRAYFPASFDLSLGWNINFAKEVINYCENCNFHLYLMPIKIDLEKYLNGIFLD